ncbi:hypothetical protein ABZX75_17215 [Streptomyces sp. NPDC003038]|uniref:hypothetical protein n=1 Tax=unclassified Streptomyces TaxID=2593676 RepID=UPI0033A1392E
MDEPFGPEYVRPAQADCERCECCTAALCERGQISVLRCYGHVDPEHRATVENCPCSAETTRHTAAWREAQVRVTLLARDLPLATEEEDLLRALAKGAHVEDPDELFPQLKVRGLAQLVHGLPAITPLGHTYLAARDDERAVTAVQVRDVDMKARTAQVTVSAWWSEAPVTVLVDQIVSEAGVDIDSLPGRWLEAEANWLAESPDRLVLTGFRKSSQVPTGSMRADGGTGE